MVNLNITLKCVPGPLCNTGVSGVWCSGLHPQYLPECGVLQCSHHSAGHSQWPLQCVQRHHADCHTALPQHLHQAPEQKHRYWLSAGARIQLSVISHRTNLAIQSLFFLCYSWQTLGENLWEQGYLHSSRVFFDSLLFVKELVSLGQLGQECPRCSQLITEMLCFFLHRVQTPHLLPGTGWLWVWTPSQTLRRDDQ